MSIPMTNPMSNPEFKTSSKFEVITTMFESGAKLKAKAETVATAVTYYHRFFIVCQKEDYDDYLIAATAMYLAGKVEEDHLKIRDVINVFYKTIHPKSEPLELGDVYWNLRDSIVHAELLLLRMLKFQVHVVHPHKYLLHFLKSLNDWFDPETMATYPIIRTCWSLLCDFYYEPSCLSHKPQHVAVAIIDLTLQCFGLSVPYSDEAVLSWYETFCEDLTRDTIWEITEDLLSVYNAEEK